MVTAETLSASTRQIFAAVNFEPTVGQIPIIACSKRFIGVTGGQQGGKTEELAHDFLDLWNEDIAKWQPCVAEGRNPYLCKGHTVDGLPFKCDPTLVYWLVGKTYEQVEGEYDLITSGLRTLGMPVKASALLAPGRIIIKYPDEARLRLRIDVKSEKDPETAFTRVSPHGIMACEAGQLSFRTYNLLNFRATGKRAWMRLVGTIEKSQPWFPALCKAWATPKTDRQSFKLPTWTNNHLFPGGRTDPEILRIEAESPTDFFMERIAGEEVPPEGLVMRDFSLDIHVRPDVEYVAGEKVYIWVDPGYQRGEAAHAVEVAHIIGGQARIFDEIHEYALTTEDVIDICKQRPWWTADDKVLAIDPFYKDVHHAMGSVGEEWMKRTGLVCSEKNKRVGVNDGDFRLASFLKVDQILGQPKLVISPNCPGLLSEFGVLPSPHSSTGEVLAYSWRLDTAGRPLGKTPVSRYCDGIRAVETGLVEHFGLATMPKRQNVVTHRGGRPMDGGQTTTERILAARHPEDQRRRNPMRLK